MTHALRIVVQPSAELNDHEVRYLVDGEDVLARWWDDMLGLDPDDVLCVPSPLRAGPAPTTCVIARCSCGMIGCGSDEVRIQPDGDDILWIAGGETLRFRADEYAAEVTRAEQDLTWETRDRTAARLVRASVDRETLAEHGLAFEWASGRLAPDTLHVSLSLAEPRCQVLVALPWATETPAQIADAMVRLLREPPSTWWSVEYAPQGPARDPPPPSLLGPGWRPLRR